MLKRIVCTLSVALISCSYASQNPGAAYQITKPSQTTQTAQDPFSPEVVKKTLGWLLGRPVHPAHAYAIIDVVRYDNKQFTKAGNLITIKESDVFKVFEGNYVYSQQDKTIITGTRNKEHISSLQQAIKQGTLQAEKPNRDCTIS